MKNKIFCFKLVCAILSFLPLSSLNAQLKADFSADIISGCSPLVVQFNDLSTGDATQWKWDLGNGGTSTLQNPGSVYLEPGTYAISLIAINDAEADTVVKTSYITVYAKPEIDFSVDNSIGCAPFSVQFTDKSKPASGELTEWVWDFGDGKISTGQHPAHIYDVSSTFGVSLTVKNSFGCQQTFLKSDLVTVHPAVTSEFGYNLIDACQWPLQVQFSDSSVSKGSLKYQWLFGDGAGSTQASPIHNFQQPGDYRVQLISTTEKGCSDTVSRIISMNGVKPDFSFSSGICINNPITFKNLSLPEPVSVTWVFGNADSAFDLNAVYSFSEPGVYPVKMIADFGNCISELTKNVNILELPKPEFSVKGVQTCSIPATVQFTNQSSGALSYKWLFGDGTSSTAANPAHTYQKAGSYHVSLIAFNANGCADTIEHKNSVHVGPPKIQSLENLFVADCVPLKILPKATINSPEKIVSYYWDFGDGSFSTLEFPTHQYDRTGIYNVKLKVVTESGCSDSLLVKKAVTVSEPAIPKILGDLPTQVCSSTNIQFTDASTGNITRWWWDFGDNTGSSQQNPVHQYRDTGRFTVTLQVENNGCKTVVKYDPPIKIEAPVARFASNNNCTNKYNRAFTDKSLGAKTWSWDFGDGTKSNVQHPEHNYAQKGTYVVKLVVTNGNCSDETSTTIEIVDEHPVFSYGMQKTELCRNETVLFKASNFDEKNLRLLSWDFGDGERTDFITNNASVSHIYATNGQFIPRLITKDKLGCIDTIVNAGINFNVYGPTAGFSNPAGTCINGTIPFTDHSVSDGTHAITKWTWTFGDGKQESANGRTTHRYDTTGNFNVKLVVFDAYGCKDSMVKNRAVIITKPVVGFSISDSIRCSDNNVDFKDASQGLSLTYAWDFGDGKQSGIQNPKHFYSKEGVYSIGLKITDRFGCRDSVLKKDLITVSNPKASFILKDTFSVCPPLLVQPQNTSHKYHSLVWDFGEGNTTQIENPSHLYTTAGNFDLRLIVKGYGNCFDTARKAIVIKGPSGTLKYTPLIACNPTEISFSATTLNTDKMIWDFNDGVTLQNMNTSVGHTYTEKGKYVPKLVLIDAAGCRVGIENKDTITVADVNAGISIENNAGCDSSIISFSDSSRVYFNKINKYQWNFGDNNFSDSQNPKHTFYTSGVYQVSLTVHTDLGCKDSFTMPVKVQVNKSPKVNIVAPDSVCVLSDINFKAKDITNDPSPLNWSWNFGNGTVNSTQDPQFSYAQAGNFNITVSATNQFGCINTASHPISIVELPKVNAGLDSVICLGNSIKLNGSGAHQYSWSPNPLLSCVNCPDPVIRPATSQTFYLTGSNRFGCKASDSVFIRVNAPMPITVSNNDTLCLGETASLKAKGAMIYKWNPGIYLDNPVSDNPVFFPAKDTAITYQVVGWDDKKCFADTATVSMKVYPIPQFKMEHNDITLNVGSSVQLKTIHSSDVTQWRWTPSNGLDDPTSSSPMAAPKESIVYTCVAANDGACIARDQVAVKVLCNDANIFLPNTFSPNGDGMNDVFYPRGKGLFNIKSMRIFNRWGQMVFEKNNFSPNKETDGWDGTSKGNKLASDVYVYIIEVLCENSSIVPVKGNITLVK